MTRARSDKTRQPDDAAAAQAGEPGGRAAGQAAAERAASSSYSIELSHELTSAGICGRLRSRIVAEIDDHLACDPDAQLGPPGALVRQFADELGSARARRAGFASFGALALAGTLFAIAFVTSPGHAFGALPPGTPWPGRLGNILAVLAPQIAFVAGGLALLRVLRRRRTGVIVGAEATIILRRSAIGVLGGIGSMVGLGLMAIELRHHLPGWWVALAEVAAAVGLAALLVAVPALVRSLRVRPLAPGASGDVFDDLGSWIPGALRGRPWRFACLVAAIVGLTIALFGVLASDPYDGVFRGVADGLVCLVGFATIGRYLGLWSPAAGRLEPPAGRLEPESR